MAEQWQPKKGDVLIATDAGGDEHEVVALTDVWMAEYPSLTPGGRRQWRPGPAVTVGFTTKDRDGRTWPLSALRPSGDAE